MMLKTHLVVSGVVDPLGTPVGAFFFPESEPVPQRLLVRTSLA